MTITFAYFFNTFLLMDLVEAICFIMMYLMIFLDSRNQLRERDSSRLLMITSLIGMILSVTPLVSPTLVCSNCSLEEYNMAFFYGLSINILSHLPMLLCLGIGLLLFGKRNKESFGILLFLTGIFWIIAFFGFIAGKSIGLLLLLDINIILILSIISGLNSFALPAIILMIVHGAKFKDKNLILAGVFFILSYLSIFMAWIPLPV